MVLEPGSSADVTLAGQDILDDSVVSIDKQNGDLGYIWLSLW